MHGDENLPLVNPYVFGGLGSFSFSPETYFNNGWVNVSQLHTEGEGFAEYPDRKVYKLTQLNMPLGLGLQYEVSPVLNCHIEVIYRKLWTDYLDDVSKTYIDPVLFYHHLPAQKAKLASKLADRRLSNDPVNNMGNIRGNEKDMDAYFSVVIKIGFVLGRQKR